MYENIFNIDLNRFCASLLPIQKRKPKIIQWLLCLIYPITQIYNDFMRFRDATNYRIGHTSQVFSVEDVLNDSFDNESRRIYIIDGDYTFPVFFYDRSDDKPVRIYDRSDDQPVLFYDRTDKLDVDFKVILPIDMNLPDAETIRLRALIEQYTAPDKTYTIEIETL